MAWFAERIKFLSLLAIIIVAMIVTGAVFFLQQDQVQYKDFGRWYQYDVPSYKKSVLPDFLSKDEYQEWDDSETGKVWFRRLQGQIRK